MAKWLRKKKTPTPNDSDKCARTRDSDPVNLKRKRGKGKNLGHSYFWKKTSIVALTGTFLSGSPAAADTHTHH